MTDIKRPKLKREIPKKAKKVFEGVIFDVYQWQQKLFDGSFATFEMLRRPDTVDILPVTENGKIVVLEQWQPGKERAIGIPAGRVDEGESVLTAAKRELLEETGYEPRSLELFYTNQPTSFIDWIIFGFVARGCRKVAEQALDAGEKASIKIVDFEEFVRVALRSDFRDTEITMKILEARVKEEGLDKLKKKLLA
jgi:ADP-ribose pyrophosphatase